MLLLESHTTWSRGVINFNLKAIDATRANSNAMFDLLSKTCVGKVVFRVDGAFRRLFAEAI